jgi:hypothetical protein
MGHAGTHLGLDEPQRHGLALLGEHRAGLGADGEARGTVMPSRHISARLAPLPPSRFFMLAAPSVREVPKPGQARAPATTWQRRTFGPRLP